MADITLSDTLAEAISALEGGVDHFVSALALEIARRAKDNAHVITGAMQASITVVTSEGSYYGESVALAAALNPKATFAPEEQVGPGQAAVQVPVNYAAFEEFGTSHQSAHPFLTPAVESVAADADSIARAVFGL